VTSAGRFRLFLPRAIFDALIAQAQAELPNECCGLLAGKISTSPTHSPEIRIEKCYPLVNTLRSPREYESEPKEMFTASRDMREHELDLVAIYHSHPASPPIPSKKDLERNFYGDSVIHSIVSLVGGTPEVRGWWLLDKNFEEATWQIVEETS
jgi:proteasome lid subunit RPN8/RPN11